MRVLSFIVFSLFGMTYAQSSNTANLSPISGPSSTRLASTTFPDNFGSTTTFTGVTSVSTSTTATITSSSTSRVTTSTTEIVTSGGMTMTTVVPVISNSVSSTVKTSSGATSAAVSTTTTKTGSGAIHTAHAHVAGAAMVVVGGVIANLL